MKNEKEKSVEAFRYRDPGDRLTNEMIESEYGGDYWADSEDRVLCMAEREIEHAFGGRASGELKMLDLGCGMGRLMPRFSKCCGSLLGLEPDPVRAAAAKELCEREGLKNAEVKNTELTGYLGERPDARFDIVLCSHIFQHIPSAKLEEILSAIEACAERDAIIIITTTYAYGRENGYRREGHRNGERVSEEIDFAGFEETAAGEEFLAVCSFSEERFEALLESHGFETSRFAAYHFAGETDASRDIENNRSAEWLKKAADAVYICRPKQRGNI